MQAVRFGCGARPALVVTGHWSSTQRRAERSPEGLGSLWQLGYGMVRFESASKGRNAEMPERRERGSFYNVGL